jgi:DNA-binding IclR family transcriptional regulator
MAVPNDRRNEVQSVDRAVSVLEHLSRQGWSGVTDVANALKVHKSTAYRMLATLKARGLVEQDAETERYRLGLGLLILARSVTADLDVVRAARPVAQELSARTGETVTVSVLAGDDVVVIHQTNGSPSVLNVNWTGRHFPLHCTSDGKVFLAYMPEGRGPLNGGGPLERYTDHTLGDPAQLRGQLEEVRRNGYGYSLEELEVGLISVAAPIFAPTGRGLQGAPIASLGVSGPAFRLSPEAIPGLGSLTQRTAAEISRNLGSTTELIEEQLAEEGEAIQ